MERDTIEIPYTRDGDVFLAEVDITKKDPFIMKKVLEDAIQILDLKIEREISKIKQRQK